MNKKYIKLWWILLLAALYPSCNDYLDEMPDNRTELDSEEKIQKLLVSAYPANAYILACELASDNVDNYGADNPYGDRFLDQLYAWTDVTEANNESPQRVWEACYMAITNANQALQAISDLGNPENLNAARGEALLCRAYSHFLLVNVFCQHYSVQHAATDLGIPYMEAPETELNPQYERGTVADVYELIEQDLETGLPLVSDAFYSVPKYHFNEKAAYTFASRFYLFRGDEGDWDKAIQCADKVLGSAPAELLRDNQALADMPLNPIENISLAYVSTSVKANFLVQTAYSQLGMLYGGFLTGARYSHGTLLARTETYDRAPWGTLGATFGNFYIRRPATLTATNTDKVVMPRIPFVMQYTDPVAQTGYFRALYVALKAEEALLNRAEAYALKGMYPEALADINLWTGNTLQPTYAELTEQDIEDWAAEYDYYTPAVPTPKKELNPDFITLAGGSKQESFIHCLLYLRRQEFIHEGMRWFDVKRYGIEIYRREADGQNVLAAENDKLGLRDNRRAMQLPSDVITAGMTPNPR